MDNRSMNKVVLVGNLGNDPQLRYTQNETAVANLSLATSERWKNKSGEQQDNTEWHRIVLFGNKAEFAKEYLRKGTLIAVDGKLRTRKWEDKDGNNRYTTEVVARQITILSNKNADNKSKEEDDIPFDEKRKEGEDGGDEIPF